MNNKVQNVLIFSNKEFKIFLDQPAIKPSDVHSRYKNSLPLIPNSSYTFLGFDFNRLMHYFAEDYDGYGKHIRALLIQRFFKKTFSFCKCKNENTS